MSGQPTKEEVRKEAGEVRQQARREMEELKQVLSSFEEERKQRRIFPLADFVRRARHHESQRA